MKILIVDPSRFFRNIEKQFLSKTPADVVEAESGSEGLVLCREHEPELIYAAADLADMSGGEFCRKLKSMSGSKPAVVLICDKDDDAQIKECKGAGCDGVLTKPIDRHKFLEVGRQYLPSIREPRRTCLFPVTFFLRSAGERKEHRGKCLDISSGGVFVDYAELLPLNSVIELEFTLPFKDHARMLCKGVVAWHNTRPNPTKPNYPIGFGVKFIDLDDRLMATIREFATRFL